MLRIAALTGLAALAGCTVTDSCADGSVLVALTLSGSSAGADELVVDITLDGGTPRESSLTHVPGSATGNVVVQFPAGYPRGHRVDVDVAARVAGVVVGTGSGSVTLSSGCAALPLTVTAATLDDGGADDLAADDLASPPDLTPPADLAKCVPTTENCFNGVDDDCDGHIDCDDSDCTTIAVCVPPVTGSFVVGTTLATASLCPQSYTSLEVIDSGLTAAPNCSTGCSCGMTCQTQIGHFNNAANCPNTDDENQLAVLTNTGCASWNQWNGAYDVHMLFTPPTCQAGGTPLLPTASWAASKRVCSTATIGGGCSGGNLCVPITPGPNCEVTAGSQACDPGYNAVAGPWYTAYTDTRVCSCSCGAPTSGSCGSSVTLYTDASCSAGALTTSAAASNNFNCSTGATSYFSGKIAITAPTCGSPIYNEQGQLTPTGPQTLCCVP